MFNARGGARSGRVVNESRAISPRLARAADAQHIGSQGPRAPSVATSRPQPPRPPTPQLFPVTYKRLPGRDGVTESLSFRPRNAMTQGGPSPLRVASGMADFSRSILTAHRRSWHTLRPGWDDKVLPGDDGELFEGRMATHSHGRPST